MLSVKKMFRYFAEEFFSAEQKIKLPRTIFEEKGK